MPCGVPHLYHTWRNIIEGKRKGYFFFNLPYEILKYYYIKILDTHWQQIEDHAVLFIWFWINSTLGSSWVVGMIQWFTRKKIFVQKPLTPLQPSISPCDSLFLTPATYQLLTLLSPPSSLSFPLIYVTTTSTLVIRWWQHFFF